jgi:hypothetical protein
VKEKGGSDKEAKIGFPLGVFSFLFALLAARYCQCKIIILPHRFYQMAFHKAESADEGRSNPWVQWWPRQRRHNMDVIPTRTFSPDSP